MEQQPQLNEHNKAEYPPMHTAEHLLNATMVKMFGCTRSRNAHIERKKSKCDYHLASCPTDVEIGQIEDRVNEVIALHLPVKMEFVTHEEARQIQGLDLSKLPDDASETLRIVRIGDYDVCACIGEHVDNTSQIGSFKIISHDWNEGTLRLRFKLLNTPE
jgi:Ser-tRNA(Ala) deacylase AlaX